MREWKVGDLIDTGRHVMRIDRVEERRVLLEPLKRDLTHLYHSRRTWWPVEDIERLLTRKLWRFPKANTKVMRAVDAGVEVSPGDKWIASCETHGTMVSARTRRLSEVDAKQPEMWCEECRVSAG